MLAGWTTLTDKEVLAQFNDSELDQYNQARGDTKANGTSIEDIITKTVNQVWQAYYDGGRQVDVQGGGTIPDGEKNRAIAIARWKFLLALPTGKSLQTPERKEASDKAEEYLLLVAQRKISRPGGVQVARPGRHVRSNQFDGIADTGGGGGGGGFFP